MPDATLQQVFDGFSENTVTNFPLPYGVAPNFIVNGRTYAVPMVTEESSVVAAASAAAKYWMTRGGFHAEVVAMEKLGPGALSVARPAGTAAVRSCPNFAPASAHKPKT